MILNTVNEVEDILIEKVEKLSLKKGRICNFKNCKLLASFGKPGSKKVEYCSKHKPENYISIDKRICIFEGCLTYPTFGKIGSKIAEYCVEHKPKEYIDIKNKRCIYEGCLTQPNYGKLGSKLAEYCSKHKPKDYVDITHKKCISEGCLTIPIYGKIGSKLAEYCIEHKPKEYVNIKDKRCIYEGCLILPNYGKVGTKNAEYCLAHKPEDYVNIKDKKCIFEGCLTRPMYGKLGSKTAEYCAKHRPEDYVDVKNKLCISEGCLTLPNYGKSGSKKAEYCSKHKPENYINIRSNKCIFEGCLKQPIYGKVGTKNAEYCIEHKLKDYVDITHKKCIYDNCYLRAYHKNDLGILSFCSKHKDEKDDDILLDIKHLFEYSKSNKKEKLYRSRKELLCQHCSAPATFSEQNKLPTLCYFHALNKENYTCSKEKCQDEKCYDVADFEGFCRLHYPDQSKLKTLFKICKYHDNDQDSDYVCSECSKNCTKKELCYATKLGFALGRISDFKHVKFTYDERIDAECGNRRPDICFDLGNIVLFIEIDENQHQSYNSSCECARLNEIVSDKSEGRSCVFIRFNPDKYKIQNEEQKTDGIIRFNFLVETILEIFYNQEKYMRKFCIYLIFLFYNNDINEHRSDMEITNDVVKLNHNI